ncbi:unnamed protein product [Nesidiocoris tenuis]|uniref:Uncharacterized protein n=1 Tax=Nesidiocoris tenuis TaxID=355587 RepID=A0A6H5GV13_9HEMI|nr:unnamed protein product [Nesidiocoris tenuis]
MALLTLSTIGSLDTFNYLLFSFRLLALYAHANNWLDILNHSSILRYQVNYVPGQEAFSMLNDEFVDPLASDSEQRSSGIDSASPAKKARVSFAMEEELTLLRLVLKHNPFADQSRWPKILDSLHASSDDKTKVHSMRSIKDKVRLLSREFKASANKIQTRRFGTNEQYSERRSLIADVVQLQDKYMKKIPPEHNKASRPKKINGYPLPDRTMSATVLTGINTILTKRQRLLPSTARTIRKNPVASRLQQYAS